MLTRRRPKKRRQPRTRPRKITNASVFGTSTSSALLEALDPPVGADDPVHTIVGVSSQPLAPPVALLDSEASAPRGGNPREPKRREETRTWKRSTRYDSHFSRPRAYLDQPSMSSRLRLTTSTPTTELDESMTGAEIVMVGRSVSGDGCTLCRRVSCGLRRMRCPSPGTVRGFGYLWSRRPVPPLGLRRRISANSAWSPTTTEKSAARS